jgi:hypothetical protein
MFRQQQVFDILGVPADKGWMLNAAVSAGYPTGRWGLAKRKPAHQVAFADRWDNPLGFTIDEPRWRKAELQPMAAITSSMSAWSPAKSSKSA